MRSVGDERGEVPGGVARAVWSKIGPKYHGGGVHK